MEHLLYKTKKEQSLQTLSALHHRQTWVDLRSLSWGLHLPRSHPTWRRQPSRLPNSVMYAKSKKEWCAGWMARLHGISLCLNNGKKWTTLATRWIWWIFTRVESLPLEWQGEFFIYWTASRSSLQATPPAPRQHCCDFTDLPLHWPNTNTKSHATFSALASEVTRKRDDLSSSLPH